MERTLLIIKPDGVKKHLIGTILKMVEASGLTIKSLRMLRLDRNTAGRFYAVHRKRPFYQSLVEYMTSGPVVTVALEGANAVTRLRDLNGDTNPAKAKDGTIRRLYGDSIEVNTVHGSDSAENGIIETSFFFSASELEMVSKE
ncbi:MAG: nucleoside-diphosphate kinase [Candidatus Hatepunaea meridiana]|nr:nucleoside-diphosphate kinase [Candidatus Hatepunaea meridiana]